MRFYSALLHFYPASFRAEYGEEMRAIYRARRRDAENPLAILTLWVSVFFETLLNAAAVHGDILRQDLRFTVRTLVRTPGFTITAILVVALGIGANTAAFSVTDFVLLRSLPFPDANRLVKIWESPPGYRMEFSPANYRDVRQMSRSYEAMGAFTRFGANLVGQGDPQRIEKSMVTFDVIPLLGVRPLFGRVFTEADDREGANRTVILSYRLWQTDFGGDEQILGKQVLLDGLPYIVIGVMPEEFSFPESKVALWVPMQFQLSSDDFKDRNNNYLEVVARLKPGIPLERAQAELNVTMEQLKREYPEDNKNISATAIFLRNEVSKQPSILLWPLFGAAGCVLLIACANLANLLLARNLSRGRELAVRAALGAGRERLVRQSMTESLVLAILGGVAGIVIAIAAVPLLTKLVPATLPMSSQPSVDLRVLGFAALLTFVTGIVFGAVPAFRASGKNDLDSLRDGARSGGGRKERLRSVLVVAEVMVSVVLLVSSGLLIRALWKLKGTYPGFQTGGVITMRTTLPWPKYEVTARRTAFYRSVLSEIRLLPRVMSAAYATSLPMVWGGGIWPVAIDREAPLERSEGHTASLRLITPDYFAALRIPLVRGRNIEESDTADRQYVAVVSESFVKRFCKDQNPLGKHFQFGLHDRMIAGVVGDVRVRGLEQSSEPQVYLPYQQVPDGSLPGYNPSALLVRSSGNPASLVPSIRQIIRRLDREQPISEVQAMEDIVDLQTAARKTQVRVLGAFAAIAFSLAAVGIHGLLSFAVSQQIREIGGRMALGAASTDILRMILQSGAWVAMAGVIPGLALAYAAARTLRGSRDRRSFQARRFPNQRGSQGTKAIS
jgi:putative ABC transport system permease protein